jgi:hypothetical protein
MINYTEKGFGLHEEIERQGYTLAQIDGVWVSSNDEAVQLIIDNYQEILPPNWDNFNLQMISDPRFNQVYNQCVSVAPIICNALPTALDQVTTRGLSLFTLIWTQLCTIGGATTEDKQVWGGFAEANNLPQDFIDILTT